MRFEDWDVLLFPQESSVPLQEFRTDCYPLFDGLGFTPTVNSFVPSLAEGTLFRVSLHSWTRQNRPSVLTKDNECPAVMIKIEVDGVLAFTSTFMPDSTFPRHFGNPSQRVQLAFPRFHKSTFHQTRLLIGEDVGRIKATLTEGVVYRPNGVVSFRPVKHIVCFKWFHAPLALLQENGIAWPNLRTQGLLPQQQSVFQPRMGLDHNSTNPTFTTNTNTLSPYNQQFSYSQQSNGTGDSGFYSNTFIATAPQLQMSDPPISDPFDFCDVGSFPGCSVLDGALSLSSPPDFGNNVTQSPGQAFGGPLADSIHAPSHMVDVNRQVQAIISETQIRGGAANIITPSAVDGRVSMAEITAPSIVGTAMPTTNRNVSDTSMHDTCDQFPDCIVDTPGGKDVIHKPRPTTAAPRTQALKIRKRGRSVLVDKDENYAPTKKPRKTKKVTIATIP